MEKTNPKTRVKRVPKRGIYDPKTIYSILDAGRVCHVGFIHEGYPVVIPTLYGRKGARLYLHGATSSRLMKTLATGTEVCVTVTHEHGLVLAKSIFHHSMNYASVVVFGKATPVMKPREKLTALKAFSDQLLPGRWEESRPPNAKELKATMVLALSIEEASAKVRTGGPGDDPEDEGLDIWAGVIPFHRSYGTPEAAPYSKGPVPDSVQELKKQRSG